MIQVKVAILDDEIKDIERVKKYFVSISNRYLNFNCDEYLEAKIRKSIDEDGYILRKPDESQEEYVARLEKNSSVFKQTLKVTEWVNTQMNNSIFFIHITEHTNDDLRKIIMNFYYKEGIQYMFYDTLKADTANIGNSDEVKKTATILSNLATARKGKTTILIAHRVSTIQSMDKIIFIDDGRVVAVGNHDSLYDTCEDYRKTVDLQKLEDERGGEFNA